MALFAHDMRATCGAFVISINFTMKFMTKMFIIRYDFTTVFFFQLF